MDHRTHKNRHLYALLAFFIMPLSGVGIDIYVPSLPAISHYFHVDSSLSQLTVTSYMIGLGLTQLFAGSISDSFGRRTPYLLAMIVFLVSVLLVPFSQSIHQLLALRFIQGCAIALTVVPMRSVIVDLFEGRELKTMSTYATLAWSIGPIIAPLIGGYLQHYFGWQYSFYFLFTYALIMFLLTLFLLPDTSKERHPFRARHISSRFIKVISNAEFAIGVILSGILYGLILVFSITGPFLIQNVLHFSPVVYGQISLLMGFAWFLGIMTNRFFIDVPITVKCNFTLWAMLACTIILLILAAGFPLNIYNLVIPYVILLWLGGITFPNFFAHCMSLFPRISGTANALFGSIIFTLAGIISGIAASLKSNSAVPMAITACIIMILCLILAAINKRFHNN